MTTIYDYLAHVLGTPRGAYAFPYRSYRRAVRQWGVRFTERAIARER